MPSADPVFVDTSAILALLVPSDASHDDARAGFEKLAQREAPLCTTSYVLVETYALVARRLGLEAVRRVRDQLAPLFEVVWIDGDAHELGLDVLLQRSRRRLSLVDAVSFVIMRRHGIQHAFAFDDDFDREGFTRW
jgi:predicted nucleic acid-binding protein